MVAGEDIYNQLFTLTAVKELTYRGIDQVGHANWKKLVEHVERAFEDKYWRDDGLQEECIDEFIISVCGSDDETSSEMKAAVSQAMRATVNKPRFTVTGYLYICMYVSLYMIFIC